MAPLGSASRTEQTMMSPMCAYLRYEPPMTWKHCSLRAPELSATFRMERSWIMLLGLRGARGGLHHADDAPALELGQRARGGDLHQVAFAGGVALVVGVELLGLRHDLLVEGVQDG